jgi:hypothetical protein
MTLARHAFVGWTKTRMRAFGPVRQKLPQLLSASAGFAFEASRDIGLVVPSINCDAKKVRCLCSVANRNNTLFDGYLIDSPEKDQAHLRIRIGMISAASL